MFQELTIVELTEVSGGWGAGINNTDTPACRAAQAHSAQVDRENPGPRYEMDASGRFPKQGANGKRILISPGTPGGYERRGVAAKAAVDACGGSFVPTRMENR